MSIMPRVPIRFYHVSAKVDTGVFYVKSDMSRNLVMISIWNLNLHIFRI